MYKTIKQEIRFLFAMHPQILIDLSASTKDAQDPRTSRPLTIEWTMFIKVKLNAEGN
jgi:hypothetical protein